MSNTTTGFVKFFHTDKGWGIIVDDNGDDCFIHHRAIEPEREGWKNLNEGERVEFRKVRSEKGWQAVELVVVEDVVA